MSAPLPLTDETPGEYLVVGKLTPMNRALVGPVYMTFGEASREARKQAGLQPGFEFAVFQMRIAHTTSHAGKGDEA